MFGPAVIARTWPNTVRTSKSSVSIIWIILKRKLIRWAYQSLKLLESFDIFNVDSEYDIRIDDIFLILTP